VLDVAQQTTAVGVVGQPAARLKAQDVGRARQARAFGRACCQFGRAELEGHGDVAAPGALGGEPPHRGLEAVEPAIDATVGHGFTGLLRKGRVDEGGLAVRHRMADDGVVRDSAVGHGVSGCC
jgi:hypothetical protein